MTAVLAILDEASGLVLDEASGVIYEEFVTGLPYGGSAVIADAYGGASPVRADSYGGSATEDIYGGTVAG